MDVAGPVPRTKEEMMGAVWPQLAETTYVEDRGDLIGSQIRELDH
jgi:hypothetical protein